MNEIEKLKDQIIDDHDFKIMINQKINLFIDDYISDYYLSEMSSEDDIDYLIERIKKSILNENINLRSY